MSKISIMGNGCIISETLERSFIDNTLNGDIERAFSFEESDYILYITCAGVGDTIKKCLKDIECINETIIQLKTNQKLIIVGCLTKLNGLLDTLNSYDHIKIINDIDWNVPVINYVLSQKNKIDNEIKLKNRTKYLFNSNISMHFFLENGCINNCSFCKINYLSMPVESIPYDLALTYLKQEIRRGCKTINLSGENLTLYGLDLYGKQFLHTFINELTKESGLVSLKVNELTTSNMYPELLNEITNNPKVIAVSIQLESASDRILSLMNRGHNMEQFDYIVSRLQEKGKFVSTMLMSGFPTETYDDINDTINYMKDKRVFVDGICPYVDFSYIPSNELEQLSKSEKRAHTMYLLKAIRANNYKILTDFIPKMNNTLLIGKSGEYYLFADAPCNIGISKSKKYDNVEIGSTIKEKPKSLVRRSKFNGRMTYKY